jgi:hypothetical protein
MYWRALQDLHSGKALPVPTPHPKFSMEVREAVCRQIDCIGSVLVSMWFAQASNTYLPASVTVGAEASAALLQAVSMQSLTTTHSATHNILPPPPPRPHPSHRTCAALRRRAPAFQMLCWSMLS